MVFNIEDSLTEIKELPVFKNTNDEDLLRLLKGAKLLVHYDDDKLFQQSAYADFFGYVLSGAYKLQHTNSAGEENIMYIGHSGEALGIMSTMDEEVTYPFDAISMGVSRFLMIPRKTFLEEWLTQPQIMLKYQTELQRRLFRSYDERLICQKSLDGQIAHLLLYFLDQKSETTNSISFTLTRKEIACYLGVSVEAVIRKLSAWAQKKWIHTQNSQISILCRQSLESMAEDAGLRLKPDCESNSNLDKASESPAFALM